MSRHTLRASCALFTLALSLSTFARAAFAQTTTLPEVEVKAAPEKAETLTGTLLTGAELEAKRAATSDTARLLSDVPGVSLYTGGGVSSLPSLHGMADDRVRQVVNGMTITSACPNHMNPPLSYTDPESVERIDVLPGITPVSNGGDSIGGTILVEPKKPVFAEGNETVHTGGRLSTAYRSTSHGIATSGDLTAATKQVSVNYAGSWSRAGDYHHGGDNEPVRTSKYQKEDHAVTLAARHDNDLVAVQAGYQFSPYEGFPNQRMDLTENVGKFVNARYDGNFTWGRLDARAYWQGVKHEMNFLDRIKSTNMPMNTDAEDMGYSLKAEIPLNRADTLRLGNELHRFTLDDWWPPVGGTGMSPNDFWNIHDGRRTRLGTYAEWERQWSPQWGSLLGLRNDTVWMNTDNVAGYNNGATYAADSAAFNRADRDKTDVNFDLTALLRYQPDTVSAFEGGYARKTRSPNLYERYAWSTGTMASNMNNWNGDGNGYVGNIDLKPEVAHTLSLSGDWHDPARKLWGIKLSPWYSYVQDYIDADRAANFTSGVNSGRLQFANHDAQLFGIDLSGSYELMDDSAYGRALFKGMIGWTRGRNLDTGDNLYNIMPLNARLGIDHQLGGWSSGVDVQLVDSKESVSNARNERRTPAYALLNLHTGYEWDNLVLNAGIENLFNKLYHEPLGGTYRPGIGGGWGTNVYGPGRTYLAGVTVKF